MNNDSVRLAIVMFALLVVAFPFIGLTPLTILLIGTILGWGIQMLIIVIRATKASKPQASDAE